ncbi:MAG: hypothetical protein ACKVY0_04470 [Prosthecobacter sp.]|uniref:hypothetical protein n=1 Tax=Prosthecobacter sp. TaxID=1965333 RepID=UPI003903E902
MPATKAKSSTPKVTHRPPAPKRPAGPYPGYLTDEWFNYTVAMMKRTTRAQSRRIMFEAGIIDKKGNYTAPYRND